MRLRNTVPFILMVAFAAAPRACGQIPEGWEIVEITSTPTVFDGSADINDRGQVVFTGALGPSRSDWEIFVYDRGRLLQITRDDLWDTAPAINKHGTIVWARDLHGDGALSIVKWQNGKLEIVSDQPFNEASPDINDAGQIVWNGFINDTAEGGEIFLFDGVSTRQITTDLFSDQGPHINEIGQVIWTRCDFSGMQSGMMLYDHGNIRRLSTSETACAGGELNDHLQVVWVDAQNSIQLWENESIIQVSSSVSGSPNINNDGTVVFSRWDGVAQIWSVWMYGRGRLARLTAEPTSRSARDVNNRGEIVFSWGPFLRDVALITNPIFRADADFDGDVDLRDFAVLQNCWDSLTSFGSECSEADLNVDGFVELGDVEMLVELLGGPGQKP